VSGVPVVLSPDDTEEALGLAADLRNRLLRHALRHLKRLDEQLVLIAWTECAAGLAVRMDLPLKEFLETAATAYMNAFHDRARWVASQKGS
jgi:hypothetical protein